MIGRRTAKKFTFHQESLIIILGLALASCYSNSTADRATPVGQNGTSEPDGVPNPAAVYCLEQGYISEIRTAADGSQYGVCIIAPGTECDEWAFYRGECSPPPQPTSTLLATPFPQPAAQLVDTPCAVLVNTQDGTGLTLFDLHGARITEWPTGQPPPGWAHIAGPCVEIETAPLLYFGPSEGTTALYAGQAGEQVKYFELPSKVNLTGMVGAPASPFLVYSTVEPSQDGETLVSKIFATHFPDLATSEAEMTLDSSEARILVPVAIRVSGDVAAGIWFTNSLWGIGGDVFVDPRSGLGYLDIETGKQIGYIPSDTRFFALSSDQTMAAIARFETNSPLTWVDLASSNTITFAQMAEGERGVAHIQISPGNQYIAWMEGKGIEWDGDLEATIRIGDRSGKIVAEYTGESFAKAAGMGESTISVPAGWLDDQTLLLMIYEPAEGKNSPPVLVQFNPLTGETNLYSRGYVAGFGYSAGIDIPNDS